MIFNRANFVCLPQFCLFEPFNVVLESFCQFLQTDIFHIRGITEKLAIVVDAFEDSFDVRLML